MSLIGTNAREKIRELNDAFRTSLDPNRGTVVMTQGVASIQRQIRAQALQAVRSFSAFGEDNDPHGEHDFGNFEIDGKKFYFKIDYYDPQLEFGSEDPSDPAKTTRVLTIMLAEEY
jgi:hypothetical protein